MLLFMGHISPEYCPQVENVTSVEQALDNIKAAYPNWNASYAKQEFDCSEMSAFIYDYLKACGFEPEIKVGRNREIMGNECHMWVECDGHVIEATGLNTVDPFQSWYDALDPVYMEIPDYEMDWWNSPQMGLGEVATKLGGMYIV
jgi:hypothetical protein